MSCQTCWQQHCEDPKLPYPCPECPEQLALDAADRLALDVWGLLGGLTRPAIVQLAVDVVREQLSTEHGAQRSGGNSAFPIPHSALSPAEWLGLLDRLSLIDRLVPAQGDRTVELLTALVTGRGQP